MKSRFIAIFAAILLISISAFTGLSKESYTLTLAGTKEPTVMVADKNNGLTFKVTVNKYSVDMEFANNTKSILTVDWAKSSFTDFDGTSHGLYLSTETIKDITEKFNEDEPSAMIPSGWKRFCSILPKNHWKDGVFPTMTPLLPKDAGQYLGKTAALKICCSLGKRATYYSFKFFVNKVSLQ